MLHIRNSKSLRILDGLLSSETVEEVGIHYDDNTELFVLTFFLSNEQEFQAVITNSLSTKERIHMLASIFGHLSKHTKVRHVETS